MRDCDNADVRDLLPELLDDSRDGDAHRAARAHLAGCDACQAELALLGAVRGALPGPRLDVARIAAAIPPYRAVPAWSRAARSPAFRIAAGFVFMVGLAAVVQQVGKEQSRRDSLAVASASGGSGELALGASLSDLSDADLQALLVDLGGLEAVTSTDEDVIVLPALDRNGV